jgi:N utilization substance protein B
MLAQDGSSARARRGARELLIKALYQWQIAGHSPDELLEQFAALPEYPRVDQAYFEDLLVAVLRDAARLDGLIAAHADRDIAQLDAVGRAVLLLALEELTLRHDVPTKVIINEAVELAKRYGPAECFRFVNAVADRVAGGMGERDVS